jgi:hypothetical protein
MLVDHIAIQIDASDRTLTRPGRFIGPWKKQCYLQQVHIGAGPLLVLKILARRGPLHGYGITVRMVFAEEIRSEVDGSDEAAFLLYLWLQCEWCIQAHPLIIQANSIWCTTALRGRQQLCSDASMSRDELAAG